jgi:hypothetical protein
LVGSLPQLDFSDCLQGKYYHMKGGHDGPEAGDSAAPQTEAAVNIEEVSDAETGT